MAETVTSFAQTFGTVALAVLIAPVLGAIMSGIDRKITARIQGRIGPPLLQPIYDTIKLFRKDPISLNRVQIFYAYLHLAFMVMVVVLLAMGQDMLMILFVHAFSTVSLILGGMSVRSPYSRIGSQRRIIQMIAYEPILVLLVVGIYFAGSSHSHSFQASSVITMGKPLLLSMPLIFAAFLVSIMIKLQKSPFDVSSSHHAHQELVKGITIEFSGPYLALIEVAHFMETAVLFAIIAFFWAPNLLIGAILASVCYTAMIIVDNAFARLTSMWMLRFMWTVPLILALTNIIVLYFRQ